MRVWKFGDDINTDIITPGRYTVTTDRERLAKIAFIEYRPEFSEKVRKGDIIVAGKNFGCGSSREHSPIAIKAAGVEAILAENFARIFFRNAINIGLPIYISPDVDKFDDGDEIEADYNAGIIKNKTKNLEVHVKPLPEFVQKIVEAGGLIGYLKGDGYV
ncbi:MAG: 3-isopropylmalate dehydratase small subunit [Deltaproteobacteria bacterium]|nr:3-isopropylmalate dehydratase small subunit [Deltaproteobacteria bacterium]